MPSLPEEPIEQPALPADQQPGEVPGLVSPKKDVDVSARSSTSKKVATEEPSQTEKDLTASSIGDSSSSALCGNGTIESGEICDDAGVAGDADTCSMDCLSIISPVAPSTPSDSDQGVLSANISRAKQFVQDVVRSPVVKKSAQATKEAITDTLEETAVVAEYSVKGVSFLLGALFLALNIMIIRTRWTTSIVQEGDTVSSIATRFNMVDTALIRHNPELRNGLQVGMRLKVRNRPFLEKDYLNKLKEVLDIAVEKRKYIFPTHDRVVS